MSARKPLAVGVVRLPHARDLPLPAYQSDEAAGLDLVAAVNDDEPVTLAPGERALIATGLVLELPKGTEAQVRPRSGLAFKHGLTVLNSPGTIDSDYRGEVKVLLVNLGQAAFSVRRGERIAQLVVATVTRVALTEKSQAGATRRGAGGFGSTGTAGRASPPAPKRRPVAKKSRSQKGNGSAGKSQAPGRKAR
jgi:dUTP diphosphatase